MTKPARSRTRTPVPRIKKRPEVIARSRMFALQVSPGRPRAEAHMWGKGGAHPHRDQQINTVDSTVKRRNLNPSSPQVTAKSLLAETQDRANSRSALLFPRNLDVFRPESDSKKSTFCADSFRPPSREAA